MTDKLWKASGKNNMEVVVKCSSLHFGNPFR